MSSHLTRGKEWRPIEDAVKRAGWDMRLTNNMHLRIVAPSGAIIFCGTNRSDWRAAKNVAARLRREGLQI